MLITMALLLLLALLMHPVLNLQLEPQYRFPSLQQSTPPVAMLVALAMPAAPAPPPAPSIGLQQCGHQPSHSPFRPKRHSRL